jgi:membrane fusion protein, copper/silver efflux system
VESLPEVSIWGTVSYIDPVMDPQTRTFKLRIVSGNDYHELKPDMYVDVKLEEPAHGALMIPFDAVIPTGRGNMVFVALGDGRFEPRTIMTGEKSANTIEVFFGLNEGEEVVDRANFLVDSESSLRAALSAFGGK